MQKNINTKRRNKIIINVNADNLLKRWRPLFSSFHARLPTDPKILSPPKRWRSTGASTFSRFSAFSL